MKLGEFVKYVRNEKNWSQSEVAKKAGLARSYISRIEDDEFKSPSVMTLIRLAKGLEVSNETLFGITGIKTGETNLPAFDVYCRTKLNLSEKAIEEMKEFLSYLKTKYAANDIKQENVEPK